MHKVKMMLKDQNTAILWRLIQMLRIGAARETRDWVNILI